MTPGRIKEDSSQNPNALHQFHVARDGPKNVPEMIHPTTDTFPNPKNPGHPYAQTKHVSFEYFDQRESNAPFGYEYYVSLPPSYSNDSSSLYPLIVFLHGAGESQRNSDESYASIRHGIPKIILCYDRLLSQPGRDPSISIPRPSRLNKSKQIKQGDNSTTAVPAEVCTLVAESFVTVTPSLNMNNGYGWNASILSALLDEVVERYRIDLDRIHLTGFSMGGYGTWDLALRTTHRFASLMPICGGGDEVRAKLIGHVPQWVHHGELDNIIPIRASERMVAALKKVGADVQFTRYPGVMHDSWTAAYNNIEVYRWMLHCKRKVEGDEKVVPEENKVVVN